MKKLAVVFLFVIGAVLWLLNDQSIQLGFSSKSQSQINQIELERIELEEESKSFDVSKIDFPSIFSALINSLR